MSTVYLKQEEAGADLKVYLKMETAEEMSVTTTTSDLNSNSDTSIKIDDANSYFNSNFQYNMMTESLW